MQQLIENLIEVFSLNNNGIMVISDALETAIAQINHIKKLLARELQSIQNQDENQQAKYMQREAIEKIKQQIQDSFNNLKIEIKKELNEPTQKTRQRLEPIIETEEQNALKDLTNEQINEHIHKIHKIKHNRDSYQYGAKFNRKKIKLRFSNDLKYEGEVVGKKFDGFGIISHEEEQIYVGSFKNGYFHGQGRLKNTQWIQININIPFHSWVLYSGQFNQGVFDGMGTLILSNQQKFLGKFNKGAFEGEAVHYLGEKVDIGKWDNNRFSRMTC